MSKETYLLSGSRYSCYGTCKPLPEKAFSLVWEDLTSKEKARVQSVVQETNLYKNEEEVFTHFILAVQERSGYVVQSKKLADLLKLKFTTQLSLTMERDELIAKIDQILPAQVSYQLSS